MPRYIFGKECEKPMNRMLKILGACALILMLVLSLAACGDNTPAEVTSSEVSSSEPESESSEPEPSEPAEPLTEEEYGARITEIMTGVQEKAISFQQLDPNDENYMSEAVSLMDSLSDAFSEVSELTPPEILAPLHETLVAAAPRMQEAADLYADAASIDPNDTEARKEKVDEANQKYAEVLQEIQSTLMAMSQQEAEGETGGEADGGNTPQGGGSGATSANPPIIINGGAVAMEVG